MTNLKLFFDPTRDVALATNLFVLLVLSTELAASGHYLIKTALTIDRTGKEQTDGQTVGGDSRLLVDAVCYRGGQRNTPMV